MKEEKPNWKCPKCGYNKNEYGYFCYKCGKEIEIEVYGAKNIVQSKHPKRIQRDAVGVSETSKTSIDDLKIANEGTHYDGTCVNKNFLAETIDEMRMKIPSRYDNVPSIHHLYHHKKYGKIEMKCAWCVLDMLEKKLLGE